MKIRALFLEKNDIFAYFCTYFEKNEDSSYDVVAITIKLTIERRKMIVKRKN